MTKYLARSTATTGVGVVSRTITFPPSAARAQAVRLDTFEQLNQYALQYNLTVNQKAHEGVQDTATLDSLVYTESPKVSNHLKWLVDDIGKAQPRTQSPVLRQLCRWVLRTYSDLYLNPLTATAPWNDSWYSRHPDGWKVGGTINDTPRDFLANRYTWVSMRADPTSQVEDLEMAVQAAQGSSRPCRVALLVHDSNQTQDMIKSITPGVRKHILVSIGAQAAPMFNLDDDDFPRLAEARPLHATLVPILLVVMENYTAPGYDMDHVRAALEGEQGIDIHPLPHKYASQPPDTTQPCLARQLKDRHHPLLEQPNMVSRRAPLHSAPTRV